MLQKGVMKSVKMMMSEHQSSQLQVHVRGILRVTSLNRQSSAYTWAGLVLTQHQSRDTETDSHRKHSQRVIRLTAHC
jgi:hypothetical protein